MPTVAQYFIVIILTHHRCTLLSSLSYSRFSCFFFFFFLQALERKGNLRHIRFSNQGDMVPVAPFGFGYTQTGLHVFMKAHDEADVGHRNLKRSTFQFRIFPWVMTRAHTLAEHQKRLKFDDNQEMLCSKTVEEFYQEYYPEAAAAKPKEADRRGGIEQPL